MGGAHNAFGDTAMWLITLGGLLALGLVTDLVGRHTRLPRVTLLMLFGFGIGPFGLDWLPGASRHWWPVVADIALVMVGFLLGGELAESVRRYGRTVAAVAAGKLLGAFALVGGGLLLAGLGWEAALLLAAIATATAPAATVDVVHEAKARGPFARTLLGVVAVDDAGGLVLFSVVMAAVVASTGSGGAEALLVGGRELGGALLVGIAIGLPMAALTGRIEPGEPTLVEALAGVFLCGGIAAMLGASPLLSAMVLGAVVAARAQHHRRPFRAIEGIEWPFLVLFFVLAGASLDPLALGGAGMALAVYAVLRVAGMTVGCWLGARAVGADPSVQRWMGLALLPQAGVALGMALAAARRFPEFGDSLLALVIATTTLFELVGPVLARFALVQAGEIEQR